MRSQAEIKRAIVVADDRTQTGRTQTGRLMAQAVADALRWSLGENKESNVARVIVDEEPMTDDLPHSSESCDACAQYRRLRLTGRVDVGGEHIRRSRR